MIGQIMDYGVIRTSQVAVLVSINTLFLMNLVEILLLSIQMIQLISRSQGRLLF